MKQPHDDLFTQEFSKKIQIAGSLVSMIKNKSLNTSNLVIELMNDPNIINIVKQIIYHDCNVTDYELIKQIMIFDPVNIKKSQLTKDK